MPTYEYRCDNCAKNFDIVQSFTDDPLTECPTCGSPVRKVFGSVGIVFKGSGFYKTDSRSGGGTASVPSESSPSGDAGSGKDSGSGNNDAGTGSGNKDSGANESSAPAPSSDKAPSAPAPAPAKPASKGSSPST